jgi:hypothetical protein
MKTSPKKEQSTSQTSKQLPELTPAELAAVNGGSINGPRRRWGRAN